MRAVKAQNDAALAACAAKERAARTPAQWDAMYKEAMAQKRLNMSRAELNSAPQPKAESVRRKPVAKACSASRGFVLVGKPFDPLALTLESAVAAALAPVVEEVADIQF